jgi:hypothetical protein
MIMKIDKNRIILLDYVRVDSIVITVATLLL